MKTLKELSEKLKIYGEDELQPEELLALIIGDLQNNFANYGESTNDKEKLNNKMDIIIKDEQETEIYENNIAKENIENKNNKENIEPLKIAKEIIEKNKYLTNNLKFLNDITIEELIGIDGVDENIAIRIKAVNGIIKKLSKQIETKKIVIETSKDIADLFMDELRYEKKEYLKIVILNTKNVVQKISTLSIGAADSISIRARDILSEPIKINAPKFILVHNHPSGDSKPSLKDIEASKMIYNCASMMGIEFLDHIVIGDGTFESILQE